MIARTLPGKHQVYLVGGVTLKGTIIFSGRRGLVIALDTRDLFIPRNRILKTITTNQQPLTDKSIDTESRPTDTLKTYHVIKKNGTYSLSNSVNQPSTKQPDTESSPASNNKNIAASPLSAKPDPQAEQNDEKLLQKAQKALADGKALLAKSMEAKTAKKANALRQKALAAILQAENLFRQALRKSPGNKQIEQKLQETMRQRYWCNKMSRLSQGKNKTINKKREK